MPENDKETEIEHAELSNRDVKEGERERRRWTIKTHRLSQFRKVRQDH